MRFLSLLLLMSWAIFALPAHAGPDSVVYAYNLHTVSGGGNDQGPQFWRHTLGDFPGAVLVKEFPLDWDPVRSISWNPQLTTLYGIRSDSDELVTVDINSGDPTVVGPLSGLGAMDDPNAMTIDNQGNCFVIADRAGAASVLYSCDLASGAVTEIGSQTDAPIIVSLTADCRGQLYGTDVTTDSFYAIDPSDGSVELRGPLGVDIEFVQGIMYDRETDQIYGYLYSGGFSNMYVTIDKATGTPTVLSDSANPSGDYSGAVTNSCQSQQLNPGLNGAWLNPTTPGQGLLLEVLPDSNLVFAAWFTYATVPAGSGQATVGDVDHRWVTAQGAMSSADSVELQIFNTTGGVFNSDDPVSNTEVGTMTLSFESCSQGTVTYTLDDAGLSGSFPIQRIAGDNVALCESLK